MLAGVLGAVTGKSGAKMKHLTKNLTVSTLSEQEPVKRRDLTRPMRVWAQLVDMFGNAWYREHGEEPGPVWQQAIWAMTDAQIKNGLANIGKDGLKFPANCPQFVEACKRPRPPSTHWESLPAPEPDRNREADRAEADMRALVGDERYEEARSKADEDGIPPIKNTR